MQAGARRGWWIIDQVPCIRRERSISFAPTPRRGGPAKINNEETAAGYLMLMGRARLSADAISRVR